MTWLVELVAEFTSDIIGAVLKRVIKLIKALLRRIGELIRAVVRWIFRRDRQPGRHATHSGEPSRR